MDAALMKVKKPIIATGIILSLLVYGFSLRVFSVLGLSALDSSGLFLLSRLIVLLFLVFLFAWTTLAEKQPILIWKNKKLSLLHYVISVFLLITCILILSVGVSSIESYYGYTDQSKKLDAMLLIFKNNKPILFFTVATAALVEELFFRGYLMPRLHIILKSSLAAVLISSVLFGFAHAGFNNVVQMINAGFIGLISAVYYQKYRNLNVLIASHFIIDIIAIFSKMK